MSDKSFLLTADERERFATYLEREAESDEAMAAKVVELPGGPALMEELAKRLRIEASAERIVARKLRAFTSETIGR